MRSDLIVFSGAMLAVQKFEWEGKDGYYSADRVPLTGPDGDMEMFVTAFEKLKYYWILNAGHAVCSDYNYINNSLYSLYRKMI